MKKIIVVGFFIFMGLMVVLYPQECGPGCPICSGSGNASSTLVPPATIMLNTIWIPDGTEQTAIHSFRVGLTSWMDAGIGYALPSKNMLWSLRFQAIAETEDGWRPALIVGTGSVQMGQGDQSVFAQVTKAVKLDRDFQLRLSLGAASIMPDLNDLFLLSSINLFIREKWALFYSYDGIENHVGISWFPNKWLIVSGLLIEMKEPTLSVGIRLVLGG